MTTRVNVQFSTASREGSFRFDAEQQRVSGNIANSETVKLFHPELPLLRSVWAGEEKHLLPGLIPSVSVTESQYSISYAMR